MVEKRRGLGRGLGALIPSAPVEEKAAGIEATSPRGGRPADLFFPSAPNRDEAGDSGDGSDRPQRNASGINKDALTASTRGSKRTPVKKTPRPPKRVTSDSAPVDSLEDAATETPVAVEETSPALSELTVDGGAAVDENSGPVGGQGLELENNSSADEFPSDLTSVDVSRETVAQPVDSNLMEVPGATFAEIPVNLIHANRKQPRSVFDDDEMAELVNSIREIGVLQPIVVRPSSEGGEQPYELVMGERRWRATKEAGFALVPAIIRSTTDDDLLRDALLENLHRSQLNALEEAAAYQQLLDDFGCSHDELADRIGRSRPQISNTLRLLKLPPLVQRRLAAGVISAGHARALLGLGDQVEMEKLAQKIVAEGLSVRTTEELVSMNDGLRRPVKPNTPRAGARHERLDYLASSLSDRLDTSVKITLGARKGKVSIEFASVDDLNRIMGVLGTSGGS
ncbi:ParB/RepB/Spo0J family partition protein [Arthrobacter flavus]|uniref:ParB/RepB/Spo0J family partition protein n=1 Tax=Arthrobacter flavus TaxID=95172 RepID=A0ABW4Q2H2_9MICC